MIYRFENEEWRLIGPARNLRKGDVFAFQNPDGSWLEDEQGYRAWQATSGLYPHTKGSEGFAFMGVDIVPIVVEG